jgi:3-oxoadipate enol-lactonase
VFPVLARDHRVIRYDARGLGRSAAPSEPFWDVVDLRDVLDHYGITRAALAAYAAARRAGDAERLAELELTIWASLGPQAPGWPVITAMVRDNEPKRFSNEKFALYPHQDAFGRLHQIGAPTLVVHGAEDQPEIGVIAAALTARIPAACSEVVSVADHYLPLRAPGRLTELLLNHLAGRRRWTQGSLPGGLP